MVNGRSKKSKQPTNVKKRIKDFEKLLKAYEDYNAVALSVKKYSKPLIVITTSSSSY